MLPELPKYPPPPTEPPNPTVAKSVERESAFSKPGKGWSPAKGTRFRATAEKSKGRPRTKKRDPRYVQFY